MDNTSKPVLVIFDLECTLDQYDAAWEKLNAAFGGLTSEHLPLHVGADNGNQVVVVDIWPSADKEAEFRQNIQPIIESTGAKLNWKMYPVRRLLSAENSFVRS